MPLLSHRVDLDKLSNVLSQHSALDLECKAVSSSAIAIRTTDIPEPNGFILQVNLGWKSIEVLFVPDTYAGELIRVMGQATPDNKARFNVLHNAFLSYGLRIEQKINDSSCQFLKEGSDEIWRQFGLKLWKLSDTSNLSDIEFQSEIENVSTACISLLLALLPTEEIEHDELLHDQGLPEGACVKVVANKYERQPANRAACLAVHGTICKACGFDFGSVYGTLGAGFIEVHHLTPVSQLGPGYAINPVTDLAPLCSNCHSMVHKTNPPLTVEELHERIKKSAN